MPSLTIRQFQSYNLFKSLSAVDNIYLAQETGLDLTHYNTHNKRAQGLTVHLYQNIGLAKEVLEYFFIQWKNGG